MSFAYRLLYALGLRPWEEAANDLATSGKAASLFEEEEAGREPPYGKALDLGCGGGLWSIELARRGWEVTGIDNVPKALGLARERVAEAGVDLNLVQGDVTNLESSGIGDGFRLIWDFGMMHGLTPEQREATGRGVSAIATREASVLMISWGPARRAPGLPRGASRADIEAAYAGWQVVLDEPMDVSGENVPGPAKKANPRWFRLVRG
jgi:SAM-dependent methyltransferase